MSYTELQMRHIRIASDVYREIHGSSRGPASWVEVLRNIEKYTEYTPNRNSFHEWKNHAEYLRRWRKSSNFDYEDKKYYETKNLVSYLVHILKNENIITSSEDEFKRNGIDIKLAYSLRLESDKSKNDIDLDKKISKHRAFAGVGYSDDNTNRGVIDPSEGDWSVEISKKYAISHSYIHFYETKYSCVKEIEFIVSTPDRQSGKISTLKNMDDFIKEISRPYIGTIRSSFTGYSVFLSEYNLVIISREKLTDEVCIFHGTIIPAENRTFVLLINTFNIFKNSETIPHWMVSGWAATFPLVDGNIDLFSEKNITNHLKFSPIVQAASLHNYLDMKVLSSKDENYIERQMDIDIKKIIDIYEHNKAIVISSTIQLQSEQQRMEQFSKEKEIENSINLIGKLRRMELDDLKRYLDTSRVDIQDPTDGRTALHVIALIGWRRGFRIISKYDLTKSWNYAVRDDEGFMPSYYASVYGRDEALSRLLRRYERKSSQRLGGPDNPLPFTLPLKIGSPTP